MRATCGWDRGRSGQGKYKEGACRCGGVSDWDEARRARRCVEKTEGKEVGGENRTECAVVLIQL
jgi:hypothetical protein